MKDVMNPYYVIMLSGMVHTTCIPLNYFNPHHGLLSHAPKDEEKFKDHSLL